LSTYTINLPASVEALLAETNKFSKVYMVGGCVRDWLLTGKFEFKDIDIVHNTSMPELMEHLKQTGYHVVETGVDYGVFQVNLGAGLNVDVAHFRAETYRADSRKPDVTFVKTIEEDLARRDFTINAIALEYLGSSTFKVVDPYYGQHDLGLGVIRAVGNAEDRFSEDPLRMMRAIRFAARYNFTIDETTLEAIRRNTS
jgi:tRNA nucleotidyltransferase (CCA-adding enzyme)